MKKLGGFLGRAAQLVWVSAVQDSEWKKFLSTTRFGPHFGLASAS